MMSIHSVFAYLTTSISRVQQSTVITKLTQIDANSSIK